MTSCKLSINNWQVGKYLFTLWKPIFFFLTSLLQQKQSRLNRSPRLMGSRMISRLHAQTSRFSQGRSQSSPGHSSIGESLQHRQSPHSLVLEPKGEPRRGRGRGVRLRGGGAGRGILSHGELKEESEDSSSTTSTTSSSDEEEEEQQRHNGVRGLDKENQPQLRLSSRAAKEGEEDESESGNQIDGDEETQQDSKTGGKDGSCFKVTLMKPSRTKQDSLAIVPKLEAVASQSAASTIHNQSRALARPPIRTRGPCPGQHSSRHAPTQTRGEHAVGRSPRPDRTDSSNRTKTSRPSKLSNGASCSSSSELPHLRLPLSALQEGGSDADRENGGGGPSCEREVWVSVFRYLSRADLCVCMAVCKKWYKWWEPSGLLLFCWTHLQPDHIHNFLEVKWCHQVFVSQNVFLFSLTVNNGWFNSTIMLHNITWICLFHQKHYITHFCVKRLNHL